MALVKPKYETPVAVTFTSLNGLPASTSLLAGAESAEISNSTNRYGDYLVSGTLVMADAVAAGTIQVRVAAKNDSAYPSPLDGTDSTETFLDATLRDSATRLLTAFETRADPGATNDTYYFGPCSVKQEFGGTLPEKFVIWIVSTAALESTGHSVKVQGVTHEIV